MPGRLWIVEDGSYRAHLIEQYRGWQYFVCSNLAMALEAIDMMENEDVVTVDSQLPRSDGGTVDTIAGKAFISELRRRGRKCRIFWHSQSVLDESFRVDLAVENAGHIGLDHLKEVSPAIASDIAVKAERYIRLSSSPAIENFGSLFIALETYLFSADIDSLVSADENRRLGVVVETLGVDCARTVVARSWYSWRALAGRLDDWKWWFRNTLWALRATCSDPANIRAWLESVLPYPAKSEALPDSGETSYSDALEQLARFCEVYGAALYQDNPLPCARADIDSTYRALRRILRAHFPFGNWAESILDHRHLSHFSDYRFLFQPPGAVSKSGGQPAVTQRVLRGEVSPGTYPKTEEVLARWPNERGKILANLDSLMREMLLVSPACFRDCREQYGGHWQTVRELHTTSARVWLGLEVWRASSISTLHAYDDALLRVKAGTLEVGDLIKRFEEFRNAYRGSVYFHS